MTDNQDMIDYENFNSCINQIINKRVLEVLDTMGIECSNYGTVENVKTDDNGNVVSASVRLANKQVVNDLLNKTGETLSTGDVVKIYGSRTNLSNRYIGTKCGNENV